MGSQFYPKEHTPRWGGGLLPGSLARSAASCCRQTFMDRWDTYSNLVTTFIVSSCGILEKFGQPLAGQKGANSQP